MIVFIHWRSLKTILIGGKKQRDYVEDKRYIKCMIGRNSGNMVFYRLSVNLTQNGTVRREKILLTTSSQKYKWHLASVTVQTQDILMIVPYSLRNQA